MKAFGVVFLQRDWINVEVFFLQEEDSSTTKNLGDSELKIIYEKIASMLKSHETIERALARLGKEKGNHSFHIIC